MHRFTIATGLALLYASAYFLAFLNPYSLYFIPSFFGYIVLPSLISVLLLTPLFLVCANATRTSALRRMFFGGSVVLTIIAAKSLFDAAGYPWTNLLTLLSAPLQDEALHKFRWGRVMLVGGAFAGALGLTYMMRNNLSQWLRGLSTLGYAFLFLAAYRSITADMVFQVPAPAAVNAWSGTVAPRRVVWVIFDEMDYGLSLGAQTGTGMAGLKMPHFSALTSRAVSATDAYSPGRDTLYSIPAQLTGTPLSGMTIAAQNKFTLLDPDGAAVAFDTRHALFNRLPGGEQSASVVGFYHPYCKIFPALQTCNSTYLGNAGRWFDSLTFFSEAVFSTIRHLKWSAQYLPEFLLLNFDPMYRISNNTLSLLDKTLQNQHSSLDFMHLNVPHLPNVYMQRLTGQPVRGDVDAYTQNLAGADMVLGRIVDHLQSQSSKQDILLIVSSDHWLRTHSREPARIPFLAWKVGATDAHSLPQPLSTVHTSELVLDFLSGKLNSQAAIADRLGQTTFYQTWSAPDGYKY